MNITQKKRAVIFMRARLVDRYGQRNGQIEQRMIATQRKRCLEAAERLNAEVVREYAEYGGAGDLAKRPVPQLMLDELRTLHDADYVIVTGSNRLVRATSAAAGLSVELAASGAQLVSALDLSRTPHTKGGKHNEHTTDQQAAR